MAGAGTGRRLRLFLRRAATGPADLAGRVQVRMGGETYQSDWQPLGQGIWPVGLWEPGKLYVEDFPFELPAGLAIEPQAIGLELAPL